MLFWDFIGPCLRLIPVEPLLDDDEMVNWFVIWINCDFFGVWHTVKVLIGFNYKRCKLHAILWSQVRKRSRGVSIKAELLLNSFSAAFCTKIDIYFQWLRLCVNKIKGETNKKRYFLNSILMRKLWIHNDPNSETILFSD